MQSLAHLTAVILAGGLGTRLRPALADCPKVLAPIHGRPFLSFLLDHLADAGLRHVVLCTGHAADRVADTFGDSHRSLQLTYSREGTLLGTGGALCHALPLLRSDPVLVLNGDSFCPADLPALLTFYRERRAAGALLLVHVEDGSRFGQVWLDETSRILRFEEKRAKVGPAWINAGVYLLRRELIETIPAGQAVSLEREMFPAWLGRGLVGCRQNIPFLDIGTPPSYAAAADFFAEARPACRPALSAPGG